VKEAEPGCRDGTPPSPERPREVVRAGREDMAASGGSAVVGVSSAAAVGGARQ